MRNGWILAACVAVVGGCAASSHTVRRPAMVVHPVYFRLADPADAAALIADCDARLGDLPMVSAYACGTPLDTGRAEVSADYDVALIVGFDSVEDYRAYLAHEDHQWLVREWGPRTTSIRIHDVFDPTP